MKRRSFVHGAAVAASLGTPLAALAQQAVTLIGKSAALQCIPAHLVAGCTQLLQLGQLPLAQ